MRAKTVQGGERSFGSHAKDRAATVSNLASVAGTGVGSARVSRPIEVAVRSQHERAVAHSIGVDVSIGAVRLRTKSVKGRNRTRGSHPEHGSSTEAHNAKGNAAAICPVEISIGSLDQRGARTRAVGAVRLRTEVIKCSEQRARAVVGITRAAQRDHLRAANDAVAVICDHQYVSEEASCGRRKRHIDGAETSRRHTAIAIVRFAEVWVGKIAQEGTDSDARREGTAARIAQRDRLRDARGSRILSAKCQTAREDGGNRHEGRATEPHALGGSAGIQVVVGQNQRPGNRSPGRWDEVHRQIAAGSGRQRPRRRGGQHFGTSGRCVQSEVGRDAGIFASSRNQEGERGVADVLQRHRLWAVAALRADLCRGEAHAGWIGEVLFQHARVAAACITDIDVAFPIHRDGDRFEQSDRWHDALSVAAPGGSLLPHLGAAEDRRGDIDIPAPVHCNPDGERQATVRRAIYHHALRVTTRGKRLLQHYVETEVEIVVGNIDVAVPVHRYPTGFNQAVDRPVCDHALGVAAGQGRLFHHPLVGLIGDVDVAAPVHCNRVGPIQPVRRVVCYHTLGVASRSRGFLIDCGARKIGNIDIAAPVHGDPDGVNQAVIGRVCDHALAIASRRQGLFVNCVGREVDDVEVAAPVHCNSSDSAQAAHNRTLHSGKEIYLRPDASALHVSAGQYVSRAVQKLHCAIARTGELRREHHIHRARIACAVCMAGPVGIATARTRIGKVQPLGPLGQRGNGDTASSRGKGEVQRLHWPRRSHCNRAEIHAVRRDLVHEAVVGAGDIDVAAPVHCHGIGIVEGAPQRCDGASTAGEVGGSAAGGHFLHQAAVEIGDIDVAAGVHGHAPGIVEAAAQHRHATGGRATGRHLLYRPAVLLVGDVNVATPIYRHTLGTLEAPAQRTDRTGIVGEVGGSTAWGHLLDRAAVLLVGDVNVTARVHRDTEGIDEAAAQRRNATGGRATRRHLRHRAVEIDNIDVAVSVHSQLSGLEEAAAQRRDAAGGSATRGHLIHRALDGGGIGDVDVAAAVHRHATGTIKAAAQRRHSTGEMRCLGVER